MIQSFIIESNQSIAKKNYSVDYGKTLNESENNKEITNNKWKIKLPKSIKLDPGDRISYYQSAVKTKGVSNEGIELIGSAQENELLVDNKMKMDLGYYVSNNWLNNTPLPLGLATLRDFTNKVNLNNVNYRLFDFQDTKHQYYICDETPETDSLAFTSAYGAPSIGTQTTGIPLSDIQPWIDNSAVSLNERADDLDTSANATKYGVSNGNIIATNHLKMYRPDTTRFYLNDNSKPFTGFYSNGYDTFQSVAIPGEFNKKWIPLKSEAVVESNLGFNSPVVVAQNITESLNDPNLEDNTFVKPQLIDYKNVTTNTSLTTLKNHYSVDDKLQIVDETCKNYPTSFGTMIYDINNGVDSFSINEETKTATGILYPTLGQRAKYFWNSIATGDINRTQAISELYENLNNSKNIQTLNPSNLANSSFFSGSIPAPLGLVSPYPTSSPFNFGEQMVLLDDLEGFSINFTQTEIDKTTSNILYRSPSNPEVATDFTSVKKPSLTDKHLNLQNNNVIMTNMIANDTNFNTLKKVFDYLEKPSSDSVKIDYNDQTFLDTLYASFEIGRIDDRYTQSVYNIHNDVDANGNFYNKRIGNGIIMPVALPPPEIITQKYEVGDIESRSYIGYKKRPRLPIYAGLVADESNISELKEFGAKPTGGTDAQRPVLRYTYVNEMNNNKMYEYDYYTRYNENRTAKSGQLLLPSSTSFDFRDANGNFFDDSKIKELGLGCCVAYKNIIEDGDNVLEFGLGSQPASSQFTLYSVDTTNNYSVNSGVFVNKSSDSDLTKFGDNSVQSLTTNNTIYLSQNTTNSYSETTNLQTISPTNAMVIEYEATKPIIPSEVDLYQQASYPDESLAGFETTLGAGLNLAHFTQGGGSVVVNTKLNASADSRGFDNITGDFANCLVIQSPWTITIDYGTGITKNIKHFRMWARNSHSPNETPLSVEIFGSNDNFTTQTSLFNGSWLLTDVPTITGNITPSHNLNLSLKKDLTTTGDYRYYKFVFPTAPNTYYSIGELALYEKVLTSDVSVLGGGVSLSQFLANNTNSSITPYSLFAGSTLDRGFENLTGTFAKCLCLNSGVGNTNPAVLFINFGDTGVKISKFRIWARSDHRNEMVRKMSIEGSVDNANWITLFDNQSSPFNTGNSGNNYAGDYPDTTDNMVPSDNLDKALTRTLNNQAAYKYYNFKFYENSIPITDGSYLLGELALYISIPNNNISSRFPKTIQIQAQQLNSTTWTTIENASLTTAPDAAGFVPGQALPQNPSLNSITPPFKENLNIANLSYKKLRLIITETFGNSGNNVNIGEWALRKRNNFSTYLGDATTPFDVNDVNLNVYYPIKENGQYLLDTNVFINTTGSPTPINAIRDGNLSTDLDVTLNTTNVYSTTDNVVIIGSNEGAGERFFAIEYFFSTATELVSQVFNDFLIYTTTIASKLPFLPKDIEILGSTGDNFTEESLFTGTLSPTQPSVATDVTLGANSPYGGKTGMNTSNKKYRSFSLVVKSTYHISTNRCVIPDIIVSGYDSANNIVHNTPFIGMVCRDQITSTNKYKIPLPIAEGEFTGLSRSLQNNEWSFINSWEREVVNDDRGIVVAEIIFNEVGQWLNDGITENVITIKVIGGEPKVNATCTPIIDASDPNFKYINGITLTNNGSHYTSPPDVDFYVNNVYKGPDDGAWVRYPKFEIIMGDFKTSYNKGTIVNNEPNFPYITIGSNDLTCEFDETQSRMNFNKMHTLMKEGQSSNGLSRYYDNSMAFNSSEPLIAPDPESGNDVMKIHTDKFYLNSTRAGFTPGKAKSNFQDQVIPISNPFIHSKGIASSLSGVGITGLHVGKKDGTFNQVSQFNQHSYTNCLFDKLGFKIEQLLPLFGNQNNIFNRGSHNRYITDNKLALSKLNNMVKPATTGGFISATLNQSLNTTNLNYLNGSLDGNNKLEKSVAQVSDALIGLDLPQKYAYSHLLVYSNIVNKYNYVGGQIINDIPCIGSINRSYESGDYIYGNQPGLDYTIDKTKILTDIDVDIRTNLGTPAILGEGSTITFKIDKFRDLPLALQEKK